jgi:hypothetical protein
MSPLRRCLRPPLLALLATLLAAPAAAQTPTAHPSTPAPEPPSASPAAPAPHPLPPPTPPPAPAPAPAPSTPTPTPTPTATPAPLRHETPNAALSLALPDGWRARALKSGLSLEPPGAPLDETIVVACEPFPIASLGDEERLEDLLARLKAGQLARFDDAPRPSREKVAAPAGPALVVTYRGSDDGGRPSILRIAVLPREGRVAILTARLPEKRLAARLAGLDQVLTSFAILPAAEERARRARLIGTWRSDAAPGVALRLLENGTFEESRERPAKPGGAALRGGTYDIVGREVRLRFDEGETRAFRIDEEREGAFVSAGQLWTRAGE